MATHRVRTNPPTDRNGLEILDRAACYDLLRFASLGRISISSGALPTILPVNYHLVDGQVVFRTARGTKLDAATENAVVAFEVDDIDPVAHAGWSVVVTGIAREVTEPDEQRRLAEVPIARWALGEDGRLVTISTDIITGRRLRGLSPAPRR